MKKVIVVLLLFFGFMMSVNADLTDKQASDVAFFAEHFILEGNKKISSDGFPIFAYMQGQARIDGFQSKLYKVGYDYQRKNYVNAYKWTFDCSSFAAFIYYKTLGLVLTKSTTSQIDSYSGLKINRATANPYEVKDYVSNADNQKHFYYIMKNTLVTNIDYSKLKKGDLIVIVGSHIMVYVGDGKIAHASTSAITSTNLGLEVVKLSDKYASKKVSVIRIKDRIIDPNKQVNMTITWPDNNQTINFRTLQAVNDKPSISYTKTSNDWVKDITLNISLKDQDGLSSFVFNNEGSEKISGKSYSFKKTINRNDNYIITVYDKLGNVNSKTIEITNVDNKEPLISSIKMKSEQNYSVIEVIADDKESGLNSSAYSFDLGVTWTNQNTYNVTQSGEYEVYVRDQVGNQSSLKVNVEVNGNINSENNEEDLIDVEIFPRVSEVLEGEVVDGKKKIIILIINGDTVNNQLVITNSGVEPNDASNWQVINGSSYITYLSDGNYDIWLKDSDGVVKEAFPIKIEITDEYQNENIIEESNKISKNNSLFWYLLLGIGVIVLGVIFIKISKKQKMSN